MTAKLATRRRKARATDADYLALVRAFPLCPIRDDREYEAAAAIIDGLAVRSEGTLTTGEQAYLDTLTLLVQDYDDRHFRETAAKLTPRQLLKYLMAEKGMRPVDLANVLGGNTAEASFLIHGDRDMSKTHIRKLAAYFKVDPGLFLSQ